jgi:hypothetical protein
MKKVLCLLVLTTIVLFSCNKEKDSTYTLTGTWDVTLTNGSQTMSGSMVITQCKNSLSGTFYCNGNYSTLAITSIIEFNYIGDEKVSIDWKEDCLSRFSGNVTATFEHMQGQILSRNYTNNNFVSTGQTWSANKIK